MENVSAYNTVGRLQVRGADDGRLTGLFEQVDHVLLSLHGPIMVKGLDPWGAMVEVGGQHCLRSVG